MEVEIKVGDTKIENYTLDDISKAKKILEDMEETIKQKEEEKKLQEELEVKNKEDEILAQYKDIFEKRCLKIIKTCPECGSQCKKVYNIKHEVKTFMGVFCMNTECKHHYNGTTRIHPSFEVKNWGRGFVYN